MLSDEEVVIRLKRMSQMRSFFLEVRRNTWIAYHRGEHPYRPPYDIRSDAQYWIELQESRNNATADLAASAETNP